jgi:hypothetical protein
MLEDSGDLVQGNRVSSNARYGVSQFLSAGLGNAVSNNGVDNNGIGDLSLSSAWQAGRRRLRSQP